MKTKSQKQANERNVFLLTLQINNHYPLYQVVEWLEKCVSKKIKKNKPVSIDYLAHCSTMQQLMRDATKYVTNVGELETQITLNDRRASALEISKQIIDAAKYLASC